MHSVTCAWLQQPVSIVATLLATRVHAVSTVGDNVQRHPNYIYRLIAASWFAEPAN